MHRVKFFKGVENDLEALQKEINDWLTNSRAEIVNIFGNIAAQSPGVPAATGLSRTQFAPSDILIVVVYKMA